MAAAKEEANPAIVGDLSKDPVMVILVGMPGCGKSHFCYELFEEQDGTSPWKHVCQDELGTRKRCHEAVQNALISGHRVVVDRCNMSREQRAQWIEMAQQHWPFGDGANVMCVSFNTPFDTCVARCAARDDHPTVPAGDAEKICACQCKEWEKPTLEEGFSAYLSLKPENTALHKMLIQKLGKPLNV